MGVCVCYCDTMRNLALAACLLLSLVVLNSQTISPLDTSFNNAVVVLPGAMPTALTCLVGSAASCKVLVPLTATSSHPYVCSASVLAAGQVVTIQDGQSTPVAWISNTLGSAGNSVAWFWDAPTNANCRIFPNGVFVQAGATGATMSMTIKYNK